jgi:hypothetical protein
VENEAVDLAAAAEFKRHYRSATWAEALTKNFSDGVRAASRIIA